MHALKARVENGRLKLDEPTSLPEGAEVSLVLADEWDELGEAERAALHEALEESIKEAEAGELVDADEVLAELRSAREDKIYADGSRAVESG